MRSIFCFLISVAASLSAAETPGKAALHFAEALRDAADRDTLLSHCALNPDTGDRKKDSIQMEWKNDAKKMLPLVFQVVDQKIDGDQAAVVLRQYDMEKPGGQVHVISMGVVKRDNEWLAAPVLSSFQNSVVSYDPVIISKRRELEHWMVARELQERKDIQLKAKEQLQALMEKSIDREQLKTISPVALIEGLIQACRDKNHAAALARMGGFSHETPEVEAMPRKLMSIFQSDMLLRWPWRLFSDSRAIVAIGEPMDVGGEQSVDVIALHPESLSEEPDFFTITIIKDSQGVSRVQMPDIFFVKSPSEEDSGEIIDVEDSDHRALYRKLREHALKQLEGVDRSKVEVAVAEIVKSLKFNDFVRFWAAGSLEVKEDRQREFPMLTTLWQDLQGTTGSSLFGDLGHKQKDQYALLVLQAYSPRNTDGLQLHKIWFELRDQQWILLDEAPAAAPEELNQWYEDHKKEWARELSDSLVGDAVRIGGLAKEGAAADKVREVFTQWVAAVKEKSLAKVLKCSAAFNDQLSLMKMLRSLSGELMYGGGKHEILDVAVSGRWAAVCVKHVPDSAKAQTSYPLYVFVSTDQGPRMLSQVELKLGEVPNRSREFLNDVALKDLAKRLPDGAVDELRSIYDKHSKLVKEQSSIKK